MTRKHTVGTGREQVDIQYTAAEETSREEEVAREVVKKENDASIVSRVAVLNAAVDDDTATLSNLRELNRLQRGIAS